MYTANRIKNDIKTADTKSFVYEYGSTYTKFDAALSLVSLQAQTEPGDAGSNMMSQTCHDHLDLLSQKVNYSPHLLLLIPQNMLQLAVLPLHHREVYLELC